MFLYTGHFWVFTLCKIMTLLGHGVETENCRMFSQKQKINGWNPSQLQRATQTCPGNLISVFRESKSGLRPLAKAKRSWFQLEGGKLKVLPVTKFERISASPSHLHTLWCPFISPLHVPQPSLCLPALLISPLALIFVPRFISFLVASFSPLHLSFRRCYSRCWSGPGPASTVSAALRGLGVKGKSKRLFPLHFTRGLEMRQTQLQTDEAPLRVPPGVRRSGTDHFGRMGNLLKGSVDFVKRCWANCVLFLLRWVLVQAHAFNCKMNTYCTSK